MEILRRTFGGEAEAALFHVLPKLVRLCLGFNLSDRVGGLAFPEASRAS